MGSSEKFCLRWNDFETNISVAFRELREEKDFFDVTLACDDSQIQAHKVILSACSPFFRNVLRRNPHQHPLLYLKGVKYKELLSVLNFMYMGEVNVAQEELNSFLAVAEDLRVKGLTQNNSSSDAKPKSEPPKISRPPPPREPQERDPVPPPKRPRPTPPAPSIASQQSYQEDDDDIQEVVPVKSEPRDPVPMPPAPTMTTAMAPVDNSVSHYQTEQVTHSPMVHSTPQQQQGGTVALDDSYADESYDYGQYGDGGYDDGSGMIDPNTGMPIQGAGADGNKDAVEEKMVKDTTANGVVWRCADCGHQTKFRTSLFEHVESKHVESAGYICQYCLKLCRTRNALRSHINRQHNSSK
eukprot:GFUD01120357.1.p1 GENE.GFUD01120357.1~~GFUD01120357.1.p1  ORF type:complete len:355 (-),score=56.78 GFUD01120357.1:16-1080(-)